MNKDKKNIERGASICELEKTGEALNGIAAGN